MWMTIMLLFCLICSKILNILWKGSLNGDGQPSKENNSFNYANKMFPTIVELCPLGSYAIRILLIEVITQLRNINQSIGLSLYSNIPSILCGRLMWNILHDVRHKYGAISKIFLFFTWMQRMYKDNEGVFPTIPNWCIIIIQIYIIIKNEKIRNDQEIMEFDWLCQNQGQNWHKRDSQSNTSSPPLSISHLMHFCLYRHYHPPSSQCFRTCTVY